MFDAVKVKNDCVQWIRDYFKDNPEGKAILGISGGKDSTIAAALCVEALGKDRVIGVMMPCGEQKDLNDARKVCAKLGITGMIINIGPAYQNLASKVEGENNDMPLPPVITTNAPARVRMTVLYMIAGLYPHSRVVNTCNRSEDYVGYSTKFGDAAGDFSPLGNLTVHEVLAIGDELDLPYDLVHKTPSDGMCGKSDEDNLGFTYEELDDYLLNGTECKTNLETIQKIEKMHKATRHKYQRMPMFPPSIEPFIDEVLF
jgi:NAD+ synthase